MLRSEPIALHGCALFEAAKAKGLEGIVAKLSNSHYIPGRRTKDWLKIKAIYDVDVVVGGYSAGTNSRSSSLGALQVGAYDTEGRLRYLGAVGTGFKDRDLVSIKARLEQLATPVNPFVDKLPKGAQPKAKAALHAIYEAEGGGAAGRAFDLFVATYEAKYPKAVECLAKDRGSLLVFYDFPAEHWRHIRTTNPIESTFATVRLRHGRTKGNGSRSACLTMVFKLIEAASKRWRLLNGSGRLKDVIRGVKFVDGIEVKGAA